MNRAYVPVDELINKPSTDVLGKILKRYAEENAVIIEKRPIRSIMTSNLRSLKK